jgi:DNA-directed RNA polymerase specialized sigma24 family protein
MLVKDFNKQYFNIPSSKVEDIIDEFIRGHKADRNRCMLKDKLIDGLTYEEIAERYEMSVRQVKTIIYEKTQIIVSHLG